MQIQEPEESSALFLVILEKFNNYKQQKRTLAKKGNSTQYEEGYVHALSWCLRQFREFIRISNIYNKLK